tara:strand:+ start:494 stop:793 length:300 start_codon:yes stop_codon:yes gene_type:complete
MQIIYGSMRHDPSGRKRKKSHKSTKKYQPDFRPLKVKSNILKQETVYPSRELTSSTACGMVDKPKYTGDSIVGIATMHKSNAVPVTSAKYAEEISRMGK